MENVREQLESAINELQEFESKEKAVQRQVENYMDIQRDLEKQQSDFQLQLDKIAAKEDEVKQKREDRLKKVFN